MSTHVWHVVSNSEGLILGVFGEALLSAAQDLCRRVEHETGCATYLHSGVYSGGRPSVGGSISMRETIANDPTVEEARETFYSEDPS